MDCLLSMTPLPGDARLLEERGELVAGELADVPALLVPLADLGVVRVGVDHLHLASGPDT